MVFKRQLNNEILEVSYTSTKDQIVYGARRDAGIEENKWAFISIWMMETVEEVARGCTNKDTIVETYNDRICG